MNAETFKKRCLKVSEETGILCPYFFPSDGQKKGAYEDDAMLHIIHDGIRACFDVGEGHSLTGAEQNVRTRLVLTKMKMPGYIRPSVLVKEAEQTGCPNCGCEV